MTGLDPSPTPLVGRGRELATLLAAVGAGGTGGTGPAGHGTAEPRTAPTADPSRGGRPHVVLVGGDAGIGKTRLVRELAVHARAAGILVMAGHSLHHGGDAMPYLPVTEAFGRLAREQPEVVDALRERHPALDRLLPRRGPGDGPPARIERADLFEALHAALLELADGRGLLLLLEDLHWADEATRDLVGFLATRLAGEPVTVVATFRADDLHRRHPLRGPLLEWGRLPGVARIALGPLDATALTALLESQPDSTLDADDVATIVRRSEGNAFFAEQLLAESAARGPGYVPADLADLLLLRLERLSPETRQVVRFIAVAGRQMTDELLAEVTDLDPAALDDALRQAVDAHVLERRPDRVFAFRHALLAEAVYNDLLPGERVRLHAALAGVLARVDVPGADAELARHARAAGDVVTAYHAALRAGDEAMRVAAPAEARVQYLAALELVDRVGGPEQLGSEAGGGPVRPAYRLALDAAQATDLAGHPFQAIRLLEQALAALPADAPTEHRAELLVGLVRETVPWTMDDHVLRLAREAVDLVPADPPSGLRARAMELYARVLAFTDDPASAGWAAQARSMAQLLRLADVGIDAAIAQARAERLVGAYEPAETALQRSRDDAVAAGDLAAELRVLHSLGIVRHESGDVAGAAEAWDEAVERGTAGGRPWATYAMDSRLHSVRAHIQLGDWDAALKLAAFADPPPPAFPHAVLVAATALVRAARADADVPALLEVTRSWWTSDADAMIVLDATTALIETHGVAGDGDQALAALDAGSAQIAKLWEQMSQALIRIDAQTMAVLANAASTTSAERVRNWLDRAGVLMADIRHIVEDNEARDIAVGIESRAWQQRAEAEWLRLRWRAGVDVPTSDDLVAGWQRAVAVSLHTSVYEAARARARLAAVLQAAGRRDEAQQAADDARAVARELRVQPLLDEIAHLSLRPPDGGAERSLTPRELQVLTLLAAGRTNRQIGRELFISDKTVSVHVSNLLAKLGASGRTEAAAVARREGLLDPA